MLNDFEDLIQAVQDDETIGNESTLYPLALIKRAINRAYAKAGSLFLWPETRSAKKNTTQANIDYYDYPQNWRSDSIWKLRINLERYGEDPDGSPMTFEDYLNWKEDYPDSTDKKWSNQNRRYFVSPMPTTAGLVICIWGYENVEELVNNSDVTIFSYSTLEGNEAIVLEAVAILKSKGEDEKRGEFRSLEAKQILIGAWDKIKKFQSKYEKTAPFLDVPDYFAGNSRGRQVTGNFN